MILNSTTLVYSWGNAINELIDFIPGELFSLKNLHQINNINIQDEFKKWFNQSSSREFTNLSFDYDNLLCSYAHRSMQNMNHKWSL